VLELRRHDRGELYDILWDPPPAVVPRRHRYEVRERIDWSGDVRRPLEEEDVRRAVRAATANGITTFAVCFLHSYANPSHEQRAKEIVEALEPSAYVYCSADVLREPGEFERTSTVVLNAYLAPVVSSYLDSLSRTLISSGFRGRLYVMHSGGGLLTADTAVRVPARLVTSGPAAGAMAAEQIASSVSGRARGATADGGDVISLDIGGTSADIAVIRRGKARLVNEHSVEFGKPIRLPAVDLITIGAGGGSIADVDAGGLPSVGPRSAGALPGPAAYGRGGIEPTVTDANVVLGRLLPEIPLASGISVDADAAHAVVETFARRLQLSVEDAALGIIEIANRNMARAIRLATVERGLDPRTFVLVVFGGAGGLHAAELAAMLEVGEVVLPVAPGVTSAFGCLCVDVVHDVAEARMVPLDSIDPAELRNTFNELDERVKKLLDLDVVPVGDRDLEHSVDLRYVGQRRALTLSINRGDLERDFVGAVRERFLDEYAAQFHYSTREIGIELAMLRVRGRGKLPRPHAEASRAGDELVADAPRAHTVATRRGERLEATVVARQSLDPAGGIAGPAIVSEYDATTWVPPGWFARVAPSGDLVLTPDELSKPASTATVNEVIR
jgi:N-methylhydantoinase A